MRLALGTVQFGVDYGIANSSGRVEIEEARRILRAGRARGMDTLDTAIAYGDSEARLGAIGVDGWRIVSKLPGLPTECDDVEGWVRGSVESSLERLGTEQLYGLLLHRPADLNGPDGLELFRALERCRDERLTGRIGISAYEPDDLAQVMARYEVDLVQVPFNVVDGRLLETGWLRRLHEQGIEVHARSAFLQGLLLMEGDRRPQFFGRWSTLWSAWSRWLTETAMTPVQACIRYALSFPEISRVVVGADTVGQLEQTLDAADGSLPPVPPSLQSTDVDLLNPSRWPSR